MSDQATGQIKLSTFNVAGVALLPGHATLDEREAWEGILAELDTDNASKAYAVVKSKVEAARQRIDARRNKEKVLNQRLEKIYLEGDPEDIVSDKTARIEELLRAEQNTNREALQGDLEELVDLNIEEQGALDDLLQKVRRANAQFCHHLASKQGDERDFEAFFAAFSEDDHTAAAKVVGAKNLPGVRRNRAARRART